MPVFELYSSRKKLAENAGKADVYQYETIPHALRVQVVHIWRDGMGNSGTYHSEAVVARWKFIHDKLAREKGVFELAKGNSPESQCTSWFLNTQETEDALDIIELVTRMMELFVDELDVHRRRNQEVRINSEQAVEELNARFRQHGVGYRYENGKIIRMDSHYIHSEITKPALALLQGDTFEIANSEFMAAHRNYRNGEHKESISACQRAFESTLKAICTSKEWTFDKGDRLPELLKIARAKGLFPDYLDSGFNTYVAMLKTGLPGVRNSTGGHGQAPQTPPVPEYVAGYALHMTATNIVLAVEAFKVAK